MADIILMILGLAALLVGTITDIKTREVPDWVSYGLIFAAVAVRLILFSVKGDISILLEGLYGFLIFLAIAFMMFYAGQWGGGDAKLLMGLGIVFGFAPTWETPIVGFWMNTLLVGSVYGLIYSVALAVKHKAAFVKDWKKRIEKMKQIRTVVALVTLALLVAAFFIDDFVIRILLVFCSTFVLGGFYLFVFIRAVENTCMQKYVTPDKLTEGDWIVNDIIVNNKRITGPRDLGVEKAQIIELKALYLKGKVTRILIKEGIPFVPSFIIAYVIQWFFGSILNFIQF